LETRYIKWFYVWFICDLSLASYFENDVVFEIPRFKLKSKDFNLYLWCLRVGNGSQ
jgi:hypothetical protein